MKNRWKDPIKLICAQAVMMAALALALALPSLAQTYRQFYAFRDSPADGNHPYGGVIFDSLGNLWGVTRDGGANDLGAVFEITPAGSESVVYSFEDTPDAHPPFENLVLYKKNFYGTTYYGGAAGLGAVFRVTPSGKETVLYSFDTGSGDGISPFGTPVFDKARNMYGTTIGGGSYALGIVYKLSPAGTETILYDFAGGTDGANPRAALVWGKDGNLYGTTTAGGTYSNGTVFKITPTGQETVLYSFQGQPDGSQPIGGVIFDGKGNMYGTTLYGGTDNEGTVFKLSPSGSEAVLHSFNGYNNGPDGAYPWAGVIRDKKGNLYGTTENGGGDKCTCGAVFMLSPSGVETTLHGFVYGEGDGYTPYAPLIFDKQGNLWGTTTGGGPLGNGTVFEITP